MVEQSLDKALVAGSIPALTTNLMEFLMVQEVLALTIMQLFKFMFKLTIAGSMCAFFVVCTVLIIQLTGHGVIAMVKRK